jgi:hypothetical protein
VGGQRRWGSVVWDGDVFEESLNLEGVDDEGFYELPPPAAVLAWGNLYRTEKKRLGSPYFN